MSAPGTALVTGAARGIGRGVALALARAGYDVAVHYRASADDAEETARLARAAGVRAVTLQADLTDAAQAAQLVERAHAAFGPLRVLVNNVGNYVHKPLLDVDLTEWHDMFDSNLHATFYTVRAAVPLMRAHGGGRIVNFGYAGAQNLLARPGLTGYAIAKAGVIALTKAVAKAEATRGITANVVSPGVIETSVTQPLTEIPAGRLGTVQEVTDAVMTFVTSSDYVTGQVLEISGGWNL
ncbi:bifunctional dihydropteridine reductase/dihydrofolate reductase TmpR [Deinococcus maricopensis]|uniref:3-oxoacyl-(Acyl-carrier-protein) reductase n=1 Tax=Deinococcus maricopensis (strain DSM 21211 / LMG 22137 / NRRL B-23946 / LB-34) TaxID=709986 RepID=E8U3K8_DEIML|nr:bifunctional dihydropteridine reductase/dihydrofolate reductase TmpR [Deinococcus maricopensis]ADV68632.1 3-oxoacyl-(acyl-carrier-protein) reductase [Deinococcus maricopensis DSM 21211]